MRRSTRATGLILPLSLLAACGGGPENAALDTEDQKASYGIGLNIGQQLQAAEGRLDEDAFLKGLRDAMAGTDPAIPSQELQSAMMAFSTSIQEAEAAERQAEATANREAGEAYLAENGAREGVTTTESGLQYEVLQQGDGPRPSPGDNVSVHYEGSLVDGTVFDSSISRGEPATFQVGGLIEGFNEALTLMQVGSKYRIVIPSDLAYGPQGGRPGSAIGPDATLIFELELLGIQ